MPKLRKAYLLVILLNQKSYRVYVITDQKVVESLNVTFDETKLPSLQRDKDSESLEFEDLSEDLTDNDEVPEVVPGNPNDDDNNDSSPSGDSGGNVNQTTTGSTSHNPESSPQTSNNSGGAEEGSSSQHSTKC